MAVHSLRRGLPGLVLAVVLGFAGRTLAQPKAIDPKEVLPLVAGFLENAHFTGQKLDDGISRKALPLYLQALDPLKLYFLQSDMDEFQRRRDLLDDDLKSGDTSFAFQVFDRLLLRMRERAAVADELLKTPFDFTVEEDFITDPDFAVYAKSTEEARDLWRRRIKLDLLDLEADSVFPPEAIDRLGKRYRSAVKRTGDLDRDDVIGIFVSAVTGAFDPHSTYMSPRQQETFEINMRLNYQGIGAHLQEEDGYTVISDIIRGGAAFKHGKLMAKDRIVGVGQGPDGAMVDVVGMKLSEVVSMIRGKEGTIVRLGVVAKGGGKTQVHTLVRAQIQLEDAAASSRVVEHGTSEGRTLRIGVLDLPSFYRDTDAENAGAKEFRSSARDLRRLLGEFKTKNVDAVVLDLRYNGGGYLPEAVEVSGLFVDTGPVVQVKDPARRPRVLKDEDPGVAWGGPLVVLTSKASASASEIVAGAVKDYRRGLVVGDETTHGKGTVQTVLDLADQTDARGGPGSLGALKLTFRQFFRPDGASTQLEGVRSDIVLPSWLAEVSTAEADLPHAVAGATVAPVTHEDYRAVDPNVVAALAQASATRRAASADFQRLAKEILTYREMKQRHRVSLNRETYLKIQAELEAGRKKEQRPDPESGETIKPDDPWFREVLEITADYSRMLVSRGQ